MIDDKIVAICESDPVFVSRPIRCRCKAIVHCIRVGPKDKWSCPICPAIFEPDFQAPMNPFDPYDREHGAGYGWTADSIGRWDVEDPEYLVAMVAPGGCPLCGKTEQYCRC